MANVRSIVRVRGFTLIEVLVGSLISAVVVTAAVSVVRDQSRALAGATERIDLFQGARAAAELLEADLRQAGVGVGYRGDGTFAGIDRAPLTVSGGARFEPDDREVSLASGTIVTDDLSLRLARGQLRTIAEYSANAGQVCAGSGVEVGDLVLMTSREGLFARTVRILARSPATCTGGRCLGGCDAVAWASDPAYASEPGAEAASYLEGELMGAFAHVLWFVVPGDGGQGELRRAEVSTTAPCSSIATCGALAARGVESLQVALWQWDADSASWVDRTDAAAIDDRRRLRVDIELVARAVSGSGRPEEPVTLALEPGRCVPAGCGGAGDGVSRWVIRTSVEVRNSGRMALQ
jgi:prepilin-type N-terminal cleavage/methylation domain-containing protein